MLYRLSGILQNTVLKETQLKLQHRTFWRMLSVVFNQLDRQRIEKYGPDRACAEWLLRCGAKVRWKDAKLFFKDYNALPSTSTRLCIEEVDASDTAVMSVGFQHFEGCRHIKKLTLHECYYMEDDAVKMLHLLKDSLTELQISRCGDITETSLLTLTKLSLLESLVLYDLPEVRQKEAVYNTLKQGLPQCNIVYKDLDKLQ